MDCIYVNNNTLRICDGDIVTMDTRPGQRWIAHHGWYSYNGCQYNGWYLVQIPNNCVLPFSMLSNCDYSSMKVITSDSCECNPHPPSCGCPCPPNPEIPFTIHDKNILSRAWIVVDNLTQLNNIDIRYIPDGKIVKVVDTETGEQFYKWDSTTSKWVNFNLGDLTQEVADQLYVKISDLNWSDIH